MADGQDGAAAQEELDVDKLLSDLKEPSQPREMSGGEAPPTETPKAATWNGEEWAFESGGKRIIPESREQYQQWAQQGRNYSQRAGELNAKERAWATERQELIGYKEKYSKFNQMEEYAAKNPEWLKHLHDTWAAREIPQGLDPNIAKILTPLQQKIQTLEQTIDERKAADDAAKQQEEITKNDTALSQEIESIRKQYPNIDLTAKDETGETLERRVYGHAVKNGIGTFRAAFRDYLHDQLVTQAQTNGKEAIVKGQALNAKKGILGTSSAPVKEIKAVNPKTPWSDKSMRGDAILKEMGLG